MDPITIVNLVVALAPLGQKLVAQTLTWIADLKSNKEVTVEELRALAAQFQSSYDELRAAAGVPPNPTVPTTAVL